MPRRRFIRISHCSTPDCPNPSGESGECAEHESERVQRDARFFVKVATAPIPLASDVDAAGYSRVPTCRVCGEPLADLDWTTCELCRHPIPDTTEEP